MGKMAVSQNTGQSNNILRIGLKIGLFIVWYIMIDLIIGLPEFWSWANLIFLIGNGLFVAAYSMLDNM